MLTTRHIGSVVTLLVSLLLISGCDSPDKFAGKWTWDGYRNASPMYISRKANDFAVAFTPEGKGFSAIYDEDKDKLVVHYCCGSDDALYDRKVDIVYVPKADKLIMFNDSIPSVYSRAK